ncbi:MULTISPECIES: type I restriction-modification system subunit M [Staphylococcus]|uniref:type I restriction-modification system subunit M n=1 Tax=Staphylococcus TaxID=1279 RepID=UPI0008A5AECC|nr:MULTISPECIES: type I restriction-modification system subunit M [Staphylococcus]OFO40437.1 restriction endonuclease subunit M [Staphylococcus sp. HMSC070D05]PTK41345.1 restriction endonuclease subunit M [Staphylococcus haemolyticus]PTK53328.1 restriction endonuclease subunit M [Staphylococcus haemolyticus]
MAKKNKNNESLENILFNIRNILRSSGKTDDKRDAIIGLIFIKFASDKFEKQRKKIEKEYGNDIAFLEDKSFYLADNIFYLEPHTRWDYIVKNANKDDIAVIIDTAMADIEKDNKTLEGALPLNLYSEFNLSVNTFKQLIDQISKISENNFKEEDLIGRVYEYFLQSFALSATKEEGEFYTPVSAVKLITELIEPYSGRVYDPACGSGGMFVQSMKFIQRHNGNKSAVSIIGQEKNPDTRRLAKMNLAIRGISYDLGEANVGESSSFTHDEHKDIKVDYIMANPPFNLKDWRYKNELLDDPRWQGYGVPPEKNANYAWILHILSKLDVTNGIAGFLLANGALSSDLEIGIRSKLIENDKIESIIVLPRDMFYTTDISVTLWIVNNNKKASVNGERHLRNRENEVLFIDLRSWDENVKQYAIEKGTKKKKTIFTDEQIFDIKKIYHSWQEGVGYEDVPELCKSVDTEEIRNKNYSLVPSKYIEFIDHDLEINYEEEMLRIQKQVRKVLKEEKETQNTLEEAFKDIGYEI